MERYSKWDVKGTTFITHRKIKGWVGEEYIAFKVSVICQPGIAQDNLLSPTIEDLALGRRVQRYLSTYEKSFILDINGDLEKDKARENVANIDFRSRRELIDVNFADKKDAIVNKFGEGMLQNLCTNAASNAMRYFARDPMLSEAINRGSLMAQTDLDRYKQRLKIRGLASDVGAQKELTMLEKILPAVDPDFKVGSIGIIIVGN